MTDGDTNANQSATISKLVKSSIEQAQNSHRTYVDMSERVRPETIDASEIEFNEKALDLAKYDAAENFKLALNLIDMTDEQAAISLHDERTRAQSEEMAKQVADLQSLANDYSVTSDSIAEPVAAPAITDAATTEPVDSPVTQAAVSSAALVGVMGTVAATTAIVDQVNSSDPVETAAPELVETIVTTDETVSEEHMEAETEALASKIHDVENVETDTLEVREFDSADVELMPEEPVLEDVPELEIAAPVIEEVAELEVAAPVVEEVAELEVAAPLIEEVAELAVAAPVADMAAAVPETQESAIDPKSYDTDLAARLDAVRAMLQGSAQ